MGFGKNIIAQEETPLDHRSSLVKRLRNFSIASLDGAQTGVILMLQVAPVAKLPWHGDCTK